MGVYYEKFPKDPIRIKVLVIFLLAVVTAHMATNIYRLLNTFGTQFSNVNAFQKADVQWIAISVFSAIGENIITSIVPPLALFASITSILGGVNEYQGQLEKNTLGGNDEFGESTSNTKTELSWNVVPGRTHITSSNGQQSNLDDQDSVRPTTSVKELLKLDLQGEPFSSV
ncbi:hypothetical protein D9757_011277 [Collybiopsis confluens]|uniref:Uncharacterized protein n=1 Tax=Collybiopsis confluens TaxID=2823264 RepID=A0A8H5GH09_9AGAR|nr:hypothetical protein D9757_011277 [Collybiopsis confluens]